MRRAKNDGGTTMDILCYIDQDDKGRLVAMMPNATMAPDEGFPDEKPRLAVVQVTTEARRELALQLVRKRIAVALLDVDDCDYLRGVSACAKRNHVPAVLLESWRYVPAVAAAKEICDSGCLAGERHCRLTVAGLPNGELEKRRAQDIASWLGCTCCQIEFATSAEASADEIHLAITTDNGAIDAVFSLDGQRSRFMVSLAGHAHTRVIPKANPLLSELAILSLSAKGSGKVKSLPLMMGMNPFN